MTKAPFRGWQQHARQRCDSNDDIYAFHFCDSGQETVVSVRELRKEVVLAELHGLQRLSRRGSRGRLHLGAQAVDRTHDAMGRVKPRRHEQCDRNRGGDREDHRHLLMLIIEETKEWMIRLQAHGDPLLRERSEEPSNRQIEDGVDRHGHEDRDSQVTKLKLRIQEDAPF